MPIRRNISTSRSSETAASVFVCQNCGASAPKWLGRCPVCGQFNTMVEEVIAAPKPGSTGSARVPIMLAELPADEQTRRSVGLVEFDRVLGGGLVRGSLVLLGGDPGIGKSTLMLQLSRVVTANGGRVLYVSGEESAHQVRLRAERLGFGDARIEFLAETELETILATASHIKPDLLIVDSIQTVFRSLVASAPGSVAQVRECGSALMHFAKEQSVATVIIGHVTKFGMIAGPKTLEHIVDTVLYFEGERDGQYRILRAIKNRFGSTNEIGVFEMTVRGLEGVANPSSIFISDSHAPGSAVVSIVEGSRPLLVEVQALTSPTYFNYPQRVATGVDQRRLSMLLAVLERRVGMSVYNLDCFVNVVGGIRVSEPATDLGVLCAVASSVRNRALDKETLIIGEVGLGGEVRPVYGVDVRLREAEHLGLKTAVVPEKSTVPTEAQIEVIRVADVASAIAAVVSDGRALS